MWFKKKQVEDNTTEGVARRKMLTCAERDMYGILIKMSGDNIKRLEYSEVELFDNVLESYDKARSVFNENEQITFLTVEIHGPGTIMKFEFDRWEEDYVV